MCASFRVRVPPWRMCRQPWRAWYITLGWLTFLPVPWPQLHNEGCKKLESLKCGIVPGTGQSPLLVRKRPKVESAMKRCTYHSLLHRSNSMTVHCSRMNFFPFWEFIYFGGFFFFFGNELFNHKDSSPWESLPVVGRQWPPHVPSYGSRAGSPRWHEMNLRAGTYQVNARWSTYENPTDTWIFNWHSRRFAYNWENMFEVLVVRERFKAF